MTVVLEDYGLASGDMVPPDDTTDAFSFQIAVNADDVTTADDNADVARGRGCHQPIDVLANDKFSPTATITAVTQGAKGVGPDRRGWAVADVRPEHECDRLQTRSPTPLERRPRERGHRDGVRS